MAQKIFRIAALLAMAGTGLAQSAPKEPQAASLCSLQQQIGEGNHQSARVSGIYSDGPDRGVLEDAACPKEGTWVELDLKSQQNRQKLGEVLEHSRRASVVFEGEFYGPPLPDPKLPEAIRKSYHPGWGHLAAFKTKLVVHTIREVEAAPEKTSGDLSTGETLPTVAGATVPLYPPLARVARVYGTVEVLVTVSDGVVVNTEVKSGHKLLVQATTDNIKTWRFASGVNATFTTKFIYQLDAASPNPPGNPKIELELPSLVKITAVPVVLDSQKSVQSSETVDPKNGNLHLTIPIVASNPKH